MVLNPFFPWLALFLLLSSSFFPTTSTSTPHGGNQNSAQRPQGMDALEKEALFRIMETMSSDRDWRTSNSEPCSPGSTWPGIECKQGRDNYLHVVRLDFGSPPNPTCKKNAVFPIEVFALLYLQSLFFINCFKGTKTTLNFPPPVHRPASASSLQQLSLKSNPSLVGLIPPHISMFSSLKVLTLSQNHLYGRIPDTISALTSLVHLDLSYNSFTGSIPPQIGLLRSLTDLDFSYNSLSGAIPQSIGDLGLLQKLDLSSNMLSGSIPESLKMLSFLSLLALSSNKLSGGFPRGLPKLQNLQYLIMDDNPMAISLPFQMGRLARLQELRLANSGYIGPIPGSFAWLKNLTTLSLEDNRLTGEIPAGLSELSRIYHLNLSRNMLGGMVPFNASFLRRLGRNLDLSGNPGLCINVSAGLDASGVGICGGNSKNAAADMQKPLVSAAAPSPSLINFSKILLGVVFVIDYYFPLF